jgi:hypothetical protein
MDKHITLPCIYIGCPMVCTLSIGLTIGREQAYHHLQVLLNRDHSMGRHDQ